MHPFVLTNTDTGNIIATFEDYSTAMFNLNPGTTLYEMGGLIARIPGE
jgi:hypothetical protein